MFGMKGFIKLTAVVFMAAGVYRAQGAEPIPTTTRAKPAVSAHRQVLVCFRVLEGDPRGSRKAGTIKLLAEPRMITEDGRPCSFISGGERTLDHCPGRVELLEYGTKVRLTPTLGKGKDRGKVLLDTCLDISTLQDEPNGKVRLNSRNVRFLGWYQLGEVVKLSLKDEASGKQTWAELVVEENK
jgi:hypothetical protein